MKIATCKSRRQKQYHNQDITWGAFTERLMNTVRTRETVAEYKSMSRDEQSEIKDVGGFVGGELKGGRRNNQSVLSRSMITLDADFADNDFIDNIDMLYGYACVIYSTHKHTPERPKYRWCIPLSRPVTPDEYEAIARKQAEFIGMDQFDDTTYQPARMMFWPSTSKDGEYVCQVEDGNLLDPDAVLAEYPDWTDISYWPRSSHETEVHKKVASKAEDPLSKQGWIGAFCRAYTIQEAIDTFIPEDYTPTADPNRWTYAKGSTSGGLVIYDDKFAYSNHNTDPTGQMLCNAYDLVRMHKWPDLDDKSSTAKMAELMEADERTRKQLAQDKAEALQEDFADEIEEDSASWLEKLEYDKKGNLKQTTDNIVQVLQNDPNLKEGIGGYDQFRQKPVKLGSLPWWKYETSDASWSDTDDAELRYYLEKKYQLIAKGKIDDAITVVQSKNTFHPIRDYLRSLKWDGVKRLDKVFIDYLGSEDTPYTRAVTRKSLTAAVARVFTPGCKMDYMTVFVGRQGIGKSHMLSILGGEWFSDSITSISGKEGYEALQGAWILEWSELSAAKRADIEAMKQFISKREDRYRKAYARRVSDNPRQCVFFGSTNDTEFLRDYTGNRRFWPIGTDADKATKSIFNQLPEERDQIWAEAMESFRQGEKLFLPDELEKKAAEVQEEYTYRSSREDLVLDYLNTKLPKSWKDMDIPSRVQWLMDSEEERVPGTEVRECVSLLEIWCEVLHSSRTKFTNVDQRELKAIMDHVGWPKGKAPRQRGSGYGKQRVYLNPDFKQK